MPASPKHYPNRYRSYLEVHSTVINQFQSRDFIGEETLTFNPAPRGFFLVGEIGCLGNIVISVEKFLDIVSGSGEESIVQTKWYSYNVFIRNNHNILRYDNQDDDYVRPGHKDEHHKHLFDWRTGEENPDSPVWVGVDGWPTLGEVLQEVLDWYWEHKSELSNPAVTLS